MTYVLLFGFVFVCYTVGMIAVGVWLARAVVRDEERRRAAHAKTVRRVRQYTRPGAAS